jgi:hypothetical protein
MSEEEISLRSEKLGMLFLQSEAYKNAETVYGYLPYNQEVRTVPMLEQALRDGKRVAVPKVYGDTMKFIYLEDLSRVAKSDMGIPEPVADVPVAEDKTALENIRVVAVDRKLETAVLSVGSVHGVFPGLLCQSKQKKDVILRVISVRPWVCAAIAVKGGISQVVPGMELTFAHRVLTGEGLRPLRTR